MRGQITTKGIAATAWLMLVAATTQQAAAQTAPGGVNYVNDTSCVPGDAISVPPCQVDGNRTVTTRSQSYQPFPYDRNYKLLTGTYDVSFEGTAVGTTRKNGAIDTIQVGLAASYTGSFDRFMVPVGAPDDLDPSFFQTYTNLRGAVGSIDATVVNASFGATQQNGN